MSYDLEVLDRTKQKSVNMTNETHLGLNVKKQTLGIGHTSEFSAEECSEKVANEALIRVFPRVSDQFR